MKGTLGRLLALRFVQPLRYILRNERFSLMRFFSPNTEFKRVPRTALNETWGVRQRNKAIQDLTSHVGKCVTLGYVNLLEREKPGYVEKTGTLLPSRRENVILLKTNDGVQYSVPLVGVTAGVVFIDTPEGRIYHNHHVQRLARPVGSLELLIQEIKLLSFGRNSKV